VIVLAVQYTVPAQPAPPSGPRRIVLLGSTGSIGTQTLDVVRRLGPQRAQIVALAARSNVALLAEQAHETGAGHVGVADEACGSPLEAALSELPLPRTIAEWGEGVLTHLAALPDADTVVVAVSGAAALEATLAAVKAGKRVCIATKEVLVAAGALIMSAARESGAQILPIDSEHSAIFQCLQGYPGAAIARLYITASGGPFRTWSQERIDGATPADALNHPIWRMGGKISVDSATLMNKGLEIIEAHHLFEVPMDNIRVVVHPQSIVHSLVEFRDGALLAQLGCPDMRLPIQIALTHPAKIDTELPRLDPMQLSTLTFEPPDENRFSAIALARRAMKAGGTAPAVLNAANEAAVSAFLDGKITFPEICALVAGALDALPATPADSLSAILDADRAARKWVCAQTESRQTARVAPAPRPSE
jgi:1-deoxy-D-xylulose-5-phosphate reductoisomerase